MKAHLMICIKTIRSAFSTLLISDAAREAICAGVQFVSAWRTGCTRSFRVLTKGMVRFMMEDITSGVLRKMLIITRPRWKEHTEIGTKC
jgi:hypothetical protein